MPSIPVNAKTGMKESKIIITEKKIGRPTVRHAGSTIARVSPRTGSLPKWAVKWCVAFSTMTIAWSTNTPMEMAMPDRDMMFEATPNCRMRMNEASTASGRVRQITTALRRCMRIRRMATEAMSISVARVSTSVWTAPSISRVRS